MKTRPHSIVLTRVGAAALLLAMASPFGALAQDNKKPVTSAEMNYQAGASPLVAEPMYQSNNPKAPAMIATTKKINVQYSIPILLILAPGSDKARHRLYSD